MPGIDSYVTLLLHCDGTDTSTTIPDTSTATNKGNATANDNAQLDTALYKFSTASLLLDGTNDYIYYADHADWTFGTGDFTIDFWLYIGKKNAEQWFVSQQNDSNNYWGCSIDASNKLRFDSEIGASGVGSMIVNSAPTININTWYHIEFARGGATGYIFLDGTSLAITQSTAWGNLSDFVAQLHIGARAGASVMQGSLDEIRISKGICRHTANFTPPTNPYSSAIGHNQGSIIY